MPSPRPGPRRIGLIGGECSGKSTLARALALRLPACLVEEGLRDFVELHGRPPRHAEQHGLLADQIAREDDAAATCSRDQLITDPAPIMTAVYSALYFEDASLMPAAVQHALGYDLVVWCDPGIPWQADGQQRDGVEHRSRAEELIEGIVEAQLRPRGVRVVRVSGSVPERMQAVLRAWQPEGHGPLT